MQPRPAMIDPLVQAIARDVRRAGGRALLVGGCVRDRLLGLEPKDADLEVFGLSAEALERLLARHGEVLAVGRAFGVLKLKGTGIDVSLPRRDSKVAPGHRGFAIATDPGLDFAEAARRRDLTINSIGLDPLTGEILDPHGGRADLAARRLRATDPERFGEDPLRALRVVQFAARFAMRPDPELLALCAGLDLAEVSAERIFDELGKLLLLSAAPSVGLELLRETGLLRHFPELAALIDVPQEPDWHPEGDCWVHTLMVVDRAAALRDGGGDDLALMYGALCHDLGKPLTTVVERGRVRSPGHDRAGLAPSAALLERIRAPRALTTRVLALVEHHLAPALYVKNRAGPRGYRRLARALEGAGVSLELLVRVARADHLGRTTEEARRGVFPAGDAFLARARELLVERAAPRDAVLGRHLIARGLAPGPHFGPILERCREVQDETGLADPEAILERVLGPP